MVFKAALMVIIAAYSASLSRKEIMLIMSQSRSQSQSQYDVNVTRHGTVAGALSAHGMTRD